MANSDLKLGPNWLGNVDANVVMTVQTLPAKSRKAVAWPAGLFQLRFGNSANSTSMNSASPF